MAKPQLTFDLSDRGRHGGRRARAGRKTNRARGLPTHVAHRARPSIDRATPLHVTLRIDASVGWLRRLDAYRAIRGAMRNVLYARVDTFRICHVSIQSNAASLAERSAASHRLPEELLLREGWKKVGLLSVRAVPGPSPDL